MYRDLPLSTALSHALVAYTIEFDNEFERRFTRAGADARITSLVMWANFMRFVGDGITVGELPAVAGLQKARMLSTLGGMERWRYVVVGDPAEEPPAAKRDGWGSARGLRSDWVVRLTAAGRTAEELWRPLFEDIEGRWEERFGADAVAELRGSLRVIDGRLDVELPEYLPILGSANGMAADIPPRERRARAGDQLSALLSHVLLAYTIDFEAASELSLPASANFVRVLDEGGVAVRDLPLLAGVPKEATSVALTALTKARVVATEGTTDATKLVRLTPKGREAQEGSRPLHAEVEDRWETRLGADAVDRLRAALLGVLHEPGRLSTGLEPYPEGWRATKRYLAHTRAMVDDPSTGLPHYPMVLHRGGWPDGS
jgi:DNA-binding MarR family transcriptional regulator